MLLNKPGEPSLPHCAALELSGALFCSYEFIVLSVFHHNISNSTLVFAPKFLRNHRQPLYKTSTVGLAQKSQRGSVISYRSTSQTGSTLTHKGYWIWMNSKNRLFLFFMAWTLSSPHPKRARRSGWDASYKVLPSCLKLKVVVGDQLVLQPLPSATCEDKAGGQLVPTVKA